MAYLVRIFEGLLRHFLELWVTLFLLRRRGAEFAEKAFSWKYFFSLPDLVTLQKATRVKVVFHLAE